jgi:hypothetical protein
MWAEFGMLCASVATLAFLFLVVESRTTAYAALASAAGLLTVAICAFRGAEWARVVGGMASIALAIVVLCEVVPLRYARHNLRVYIGIAGGVYFGVHLLRPRTKEKFRAAREARARLAARES